jgi:flagellar protein FlaI
MGLLEKAQMIKQKQDTQQIYSTGDTIIKEYNTTQMSLLEKARQHRQKQTTQTLHPTRSGIEIIEEAKGLGWGGLANRRVVYDHSINEYRYEVIEPTLNEKEKEIKKELTHLFKMLADVNTFDMTTEEKHRFLTDTLERIIIDNNIRFDHKFKSKIKELEEEKSKQKKTKPDKKEKKPLFSKNKKDKPEDITISKEKIFYHIFRDFLGYGKIDLLMHDDGIEDISCDGPDTPIFIHHRKYEAIETNIYFENEEELNSLIVRLCQISGKQISIYSPIVDGKLPDGSRLQATLARTVTKGSTFTIRKFREDPLTPIDLIAYKSMSLEMAAYFWLAIEYGASILICGGTASGKTTALNALSLFIPASHKIISIEDTREVNLPHKNWIAGTTRAGFSTSDENKTGKDIDMFDLIRAALRQRPRVIIVGEVRGREAYVLFQAMATGHTSYATIHASDIHTLIQRLENPPISLPRALLTSLDIIVFQNAVEINGKMVRRMTSVTEIIKLDSDTNQLIFMAPFTWVSKTDDRFESSRSSKVLTRIRQQNDWSEERLEEEIHNRMLVLEWMLKKGIRGYREVGRVIHDYYKHPEDVIKRAMEELNQ